MNGANKVIVIGASAGGVEALQFLLQGLPESLHLPIVIVMHLPEHSDIHFGKVISAPGYQVREAKDKMPIEEKTISFAPPGYHLLIEKNRTFSLTQDEPVHFSRPSIDVLFESAALVYRKNAIGILLTGANDDGAAGLKRIHDLGGQTIVQDPRSAHVRIMPEAALSLFKPDWVLSLAQIQRFFETAREGDLSWKI